MHLVLEFCPGGELFFLLQKHRRFPEPLAKFYFYELVIGLEYLHSQNIMYRDLKVSDTILAIMFECSLKTYCSIWMDI